MASAASRKPFQPANSLTSRTFIGLLVAQFFAAFNDQAIHASAMFFAFKTRVLNEPQAISLMPILFYAPWAIFCTMSGYFADKYSKQYSLIFWKLAEVGITAIATLGFYLGAHGQDSLGTWIVLSTVFMMGTHSAFFVPAKYGVMPEILQPHLLSRGNGILESLSFLAVILGTVFGGVLSKYFERQEEYIGITLFGLAILGALFSLLIEKMPAANPLIKFPAYVFGPLLTNLRILFASKPLRLAVIVIAFFTFVVAFMRQTVYMLGEAQNPRWNELKTSVIVGTVALGIGLGSPLAGWLSGRKVELGLIPIGAFGMIVGCVIAAGLLGYIPGLIACIILIGFMTGFYLVPMYTLLQYRAPKQSKGNMIATSNFINVTGAIASSLLFFVLVTSAKQSGFVPQVNPEDLATGTLETLQLDHGRPIGFLVRNGDQTLRIGQVTTPEKSGDLFDSPANADLTIHMGRAITEGMAVTVSRYDLAVDNVRSVQHFTLRPKGAEQEPAYDFRKLPEMLFLGAGAMTLLTLFVLIGTLRDLVSRSLWFLKSLGTRTHVDHLKNLPGSGPVILVTNNGATNCQRSIIAATDRFTRFFGVNERSANDVQQAIAILERGDLIGVTLSNDNESASLDAFLAQVQAGLKQRADYVPTSTSLVNLPTRGEVLRINFGEAMPSSESAMALSQRLRELQSSEMEQD